MTARPDLPEVSEEHQAFPAAWLGFGVRAVLCLRGWPRAGAMAGPGTAAVSE